MTTQLLSLPSELLVLILSFLPLRSIPACRLTCGRLHAVITNSGLLQCRIHILNKYMESLSPPDLSTADFLENLEKWEEAWSTFSLEREATTQTMSKPFQLFGKYLLQSGYLIQVCPFQDVHWSYVDLSTQCDINGRGRSAAQWKDIKLESLTRITEWALDIDQDLVVVSYLAREPRKKKHLEIRLLDFLKGINHKSATVPVIRLNFEGKYDKFFETHIEIMGNYLVVLHAHRSHFRGYQTLYLVDWVRGQLIHRRRVAADTFHPVLNSISGDTLVLGLKRNWALELCRIAEQGDTLTFRTLCILKLPAVRWKTETKLSNFNRTSSTTESPSASVGRSALPFRSSPSASVLPFAVDVRRGKNGKRALFFALPSSLCTLAETVTMQAQGKEDMDANKGHSNERRWLGRRSLRALPSKPPVIPWDDWGPKMTRWIMPGNVIALDVSGMRCAFSLPTRSGAAVSVLDFNPGRLARFFPVREPRNGERIGIRTTPTIIKRGIFFSRDFESNLAYYLIKRGPVQGRILIDDEWVAQIKLLDTAGGDDTILVQSVVGTREGHVELP